MYEHYSKIAAVIFGSVALMGYNDMTVPLIVFMNYLSLEKMDERTHI